MRLPSLRAFLIQLVDRSRRSALLTLLIFIAITTAGLVYGTKHLSIDTDTDHLFAASLPWRRQEIKFSREFPQFDNLIVVVVRATTPEQADLTATALAARVARDKKNFVSVSRPGTGNFYNQNGFLLLPSRQLATLLNSIVTAQPFLGQLAADPSAAGLFNALGLIARGAEAGQASLAPYTKQLSALEVALQADAAGHPKDLSWQSLISPGLSSTQSNDQFVLVHPVLNHNSLEPGGTATAALRRIAATLPAVRTGQATVDYTGQIPLSDEQFASLKQGMVAGLVISIALITLWLTFAVRSWRMIVPILLTLLAGLALTISFAGIAIGTLNLISVAFAILFVGLAVDFAIQFCVRLRDVRRRVGDPAVALRGAAAEAGGQIALASIATACGFLAFVPTAFIGVAELGLIAGVGMIIAFFCTVTLLPALLWLTQPRGEERRIGFAFGDYADDVVVRRRRPILLMFGILALAGAASVATLGFDANPLDTQNPNGEAMRTLKSLLGDAVTNPFYIDILAPSLTQAVALTAQLDKLPEVAQVVSGATFIPPNQTQKLALIQQTRQILLPTLGTDAPPSVTPARIRQAAASAAAAIGKIAPKLRPGSPLIGIGEALQSLKAATDQRLMATNAALTKFLPGELQRLSLALSAAPIAFASLPQDLKASWFLPDGEVRIQVIPTAAAQTSAGLFKFVRVVSRIAPGAGGPAVTTVATAETILTAFREAAGLAAVAIALILVIVLRSARDAALVVVTLTLSALLTALFAKLAGISVDYANIIALPLLLGVGVSFNVYFVMNWRAGMKHLLGSATARAVLFSALTTGTAFGSLAASHDRGTASMGEVLLLSLVAVLISTFIFLPALLHSLMRR